MSFIIAGMAATGTTILKNAFQVDKGYENIEQQIERVGCTHTKILILCLTLTLFLHQKLLA